MKSFKVFLSALLLFIACGAVAQTKKVDHFSKIIVSPYIQVTLVQGNEESVTINSLKVDENKVHIEVADNTLRIYLEGAKDFPKNEKKKENGNKTTYSMYPKTSVTATITYATLKTLSVRGEDSLLCEGPIEGDAFALKIYGEPAVIFNKMNLKELSAVMYGEGSLLIKSGAIKNQKYTCYGEGKINSLAINGNTSRLVSYGESDFKLNVSDRIKITAFGDAKVHYKGSPSIDKGIHIGDLTIDKMD